MSQAVDKIKFRVAIGALLLLISMQFLAIAHANEHTLNSSEPVCITHIELSQFSNLIPSDSILSQLFTPIFVHYVLTPHTIYPATSTNYFSRAPPSFK